MSDGEGEALPGDPLEAARSERGYTLPLHGVLAAEDPDVLAAYEGMMKALYLKGRRLDGKTKELVYVAALVALGATEEHVRAHMERAQREGASPEDVLEALELLIPAAGVARASAGFEIWRRVFRSGA
ncbi:MAG: carboxymuconolactone decarboxylase family protein [Dehalococcoidia bacterium]